MLSRVVEAGSVECFKRRLDVVLGSKWLYTIGVLRIGLFVSCLLVVLTL